MARRVPAEWTPPAAHRQAGVFTAAQAVAAGLTEHQVRARTRGGRWERVVGSGLMVAGAPATPTQQVQAAALTWPDAVGCLSTAARVHGLPVPDDGLVHVSTAANRHDRGVLRPHVFSYDRAETTRVADARITTRRRTIIDCLGWLPREHSDGLLAWVVSRRLIGADDLDGWLVEHPGARGNTARHRAAAARRRGAAGEAELVLHRLLVQAGVDGWCGNEPLLAHLGVPATADVYFPAVRLVVEVDGRTYHGAERFQSDRTRQNALVAAGCTVLRYTWADLTQRPAEVIAQIRAMLDTLEHRAR
jgi:very-short-patch-repair endonuclease